MKTLLFSISFAAVFAASADTSRALAPIGVFDSGVGGLTVLEQLLKVDCVDNASGKDGADGIPDLEGEEFVQLGDQANLHYGSYAAAGGSAFLRELAIRDAFFLLSEGYYVNPAEEIPSGRKTPAKIIVIACNTATAYGLAGIEATLKKIASPVKVIGVVNAGSRSVFDTLKVGPKTASFSVGVMSTPGTDASGVYPRTILFEAAKRGMKEPPRIVHRGCENLAKAVEESSPEGPKIVRRYFREIVEELRDAKAKEPLRALVFGCTHYPILRRAFDETLAEIRADSTLAPYVADDFVFIDPAVATAVECRASLAADGLLANRKCPSKARMFVSAPVAGLPKELVGEKGMLAESYKYTRKPGLDIIDTRFVPAETCIADRQAFDRVLNMLPAVKGKLGR